MILDSNGIGWTYLRTFSAAVASVNIHRNSLICYRGYDCFGRKRTMDHAIIARLPLRLVTSLGINFRESDANCFFVCRFSKGASLAGCDAREIVAHQAGVFVRENNRCAFNIHTKFRSGFSYHPVWASLDAVIAFCAAREKSGFLGRAWWSDIGWQGWSWNYRWLRR